MFYAMKAEPPYGRYETYLALDEAMGFSWQGNPRCHCCGKALDRIDHWQVEGGIGKGYCNTIVCNELCANMFILSRL